MRTMTDTPPSSEIRDPQQPSHVDVSLVIGTPLGYRELPLAALMEIHEPGSWETMSKKLEVSQRD